MPPAHLAGLLQILDRGAITVASARTAFARMAAAGLDAATAVQQLGLDKISDAATLLPLVRAAIAANPAAVADLRAGRTRAADAIKGHVMRATRGKADPTVVDQLLRGALDP